MLRLPKRVAAAASFIAVTVALVAAGHGADLGGLTTAPPVPDEGVPCGAPVVQSFPSVWLGHFTGGFSHYTGPGGVIITDWRDEKLCFPDRQACRRFIADMRRDYSTPEGYFTCLPIR